MNTLLTFKAAHIIAFTAWIGSLYYLGRLLVYHRMAKNSSPRDKEVLLPYFQNLEKKAYQYVCTPAMLFTLIFGVVMLILDPKYLKLGWMHIKITLVLLLIGYHHIAKSHMKKLAADKEKWDVAGYRIFNQFLVLFLVSIVYIASMKLLVNYFHLAIGLIVIYLLMYFLTVNRKEQTSP